MSKNLKSSGISVDKYWSKYAQRKVNAQNKVAEMMCEILAEQSGVVLEGKFWNLEEWKKTYVREIGAALYLLRLGYTYDTIKRTLNDKFVRKNLKTLYWLPYGKMNLILKKYSVSVVQKDVDTSNNSIRTINKPRKGIASKLEEKDG